jgi:hypothetical protein
VQTHGVRNCGSYHELSGCQFALYTLTQAAQRPYKHLLCHHRACTSSCRAQTVRYIIVPRAGVRRVSQTKISLWSSTARSSSLSTAQDIAVVVDRPIIFASCRQPPTCADSPRHYLSHRHETCLKHKTHPVPTELAAILTTRHWSVRARHTAAYPGSAAVFTYRVVRADSRQAKLRWLAKLHGCQFAPYLLARAAQRPCQHLLRHHFTSIRFALASDPPVSE